MDRISLFKTKLLKFKVSEATCRLRDNLNAFLWLLGFDGGKNWEELSFPGTLVWAVNEPVSKW